MENTWGVCHASVGTNLSAMPAATMWAGMYPMAWQEFQCSTDKTPPLQAHDRLADVLEEIGIGSTNGSHTVLDIKAFRDSLRDRPIYSRFMLRNAADQLIRARRGQDFTLLDCYGKPFFFPGENLSSLEYVLLMIMQENTHSSANTPTVKLLSYSTPGSMNSPKSSKLMTSALRSHSF